MTLQSGPVAVAFLAFALWGCQTLTTTHEPVNAPVPVKPRVGQYYFLPKKLIQITGTSNETAYSIAMQELIEADRDYRYFLHLGKNIFYDDHTVLTTNSKGLLSTVNVTTTDATPAIIDTLAEMAVNLARIAANTSAAKGGGNPPDPFDVVFDPFDELQVTRAAKRMFDSGVILTHLPLPAVKTHFTGDIKKGTAPSPDGVFFRPPTIASFEISTAEGRSGHVYRRFGVTVPDKRTVAVLPYNREFLVTKQLNATFTDGQLTSVDYQLPSQARAAVGIPANIVKRVAEAIPEIVRVRNENRSDPNAAINAQAALLNAQAGLLNAKKALKDAEKNAD
jgi:hypothetical protein